MSFDDFFRTMGSHDLALPLDQEELFYIAGMTTSHNYIYIYTFIYLLKVKLILMVMDGYH